MRELYQRLITEGWIDPWLDEDRLVPGEDWDVEIENAIETGEAVIVCQTTWGICSITEKKEEYS